MRDTTKILARQLWSVDGIALAMIIERDGKRSAVTNMVFSELQIGDETPTACVLGHHEAQILMDELWSCGLRPTEGKGSAGAMAAVQEHLKDLRRLVFADKAAET